MRFSVTVRDANDREWSAIRDDERRALHRAAVHMINDHDSTTKAAGKAAQLALIYGAPITSAIIVLNQFGFTVGVKELIDDWEEPNETSGKPDPIESKVIF